MKTTYNKKEREDLYVLGNGLLALVSIVLDRDDCTPLLGRKPLVRLEKQAWAFLRASRGAL